MKAKNLTIDEIIKKHIKKSKIPGISIGLIDEHGSQFFNHGEIKKRIWNNTYI